MADIYEDKFGPRMLKAIVLTLKDEINTLRAEAGLPERTNEQVENALETKYSSLS